MSLVAQACIVGLEYPRSVTPRVRRQLARSARAASRYARATLSRIAAATMALLIVLPFTPPFSTCDAEPLMASFGIGVASVAASLDSHEIVITEAPPDSAVRPSVVLDEDSHDGAVLRAPACHLRVARAPVVRVAPAHDTVPHAAPLALRV
jgi:hypothetical protein